MDCSKRPAIQNKEKSVKGLVFIQAQTYFFEQKIRSFVDVLFNEWEEQFNRNNNLLSIDNTISNETFTPISESFAQKLEQDHMNSLTGSFLWN